MSSPNQLSFLPDDYLVRKAQRRTNVVCAMLFVVVMSAIGTAFYYTERSLRAVVDENVRVNQEYTEEAKRIEQYKLVEEKQKKIQQQADLTSSLFENVPRSTLLAEFTNALPSGVYLLDLNLDSKPRQRAAVVAKTMYEQKKAQLEAKKAAPEPKQFDVALKLTGVAQTDVQVAQFINKLSHSKLLRDVNLVIVEEYNVEGEKARKFQLDMALSRDAEIEPATRPVTKTAAIEVEAN